MMEKFNTALLPSHPDLHFETSLWNDHIEYIAGIDEAGRGALAGEVAAAAVILPKDNALLQLLSGVRDSKQMTPYQRERWAAEIKNVAITWAVGYATNDEIDAEGILPATCLAIHRALQALIIHPQYLLVDYIDLPSCEIPQIPLVKGDARSLSIASASVLAKTARDELMRQYDRLFPGYGFARHKGYGTAGHRAAIHQMGGCPLHRQSFAPLNQMNTQGGTHE